MGKVGWGGGQWFRVYCKPCPPHSPHVWCPQAVPVLGVEGVVESGRGV